MARSTSSSPFCLAFKQLRVLLWKSLIIRRVHFISSFFELVGPLILTIAVTILYAKFGQNDDSKVNEREKIGPIYYGNWINITYNSRDDFGSGSSRYSFDRVRGIYYAPKEAEALMKHFIPNPNEPTPTPDPFWRDQYNNSHWKSPDLQLVPFETEEEMNAEYKSNVTEFSNIIMSVYFVNLPKALETGQLSYRIQIPGNTRVMTMTQGLFPLKFNEAPFIKDISDARYEEVFSTNRRIATMNAYINRGFIETVCRNHSIAGCEAAFRPIQTKLMPYPKYRNPSLSLFSIQDGFAIVLPLSYLVFVPLIVKRITDEKSTKAKELLRLIGMSDFVFWFAHFINYFVVVVVHSFLVTLLMWVFKVSVFTFSSPILFALGYLMYGAQMILFSMLITTIFNRPVIATIVTSILWIVLCVVIFNNLMPSVQGTINISRTNAARIGTSFLPSGSIIWFVSIMGAFEASGQGLGFGNLASRTRVYGSLTELHVMLSMLASYFAYIFLIWYLDNVWPFQHGVPKSPIFFLKPSYWCSGGGQQSASSANGVHAKELDPRVFEPEPKDLNASIRVENLVKRFSKFGEGKKTAVDHLWLNIYENQITVLLGHNGAGKTTTMNMITGMFGSTSGQIYVNGYNVFTQTKAARRSIGLCPQENIIFNELTVAQHLYLFAALKDYPASQIDDEVRKTISLLKLEDKRNVLATKLSGGMKRKLSLGIALVGETETLILDEPTSGMDPDARRVIWDLLLSIRRSRTILLTTHYMEEADVLGDRIAIMNDGKLCCSGTPFFLKSAFGTGYRLRIAKQQGAFDSTRFQSVLRRFVPSATLNTEIETEVIYTLDDATTDKKELMAVLPELFDDIERHKVKYGIDSCGLSYATLEDVFLTVGSDVNLTASPEKSTNLDHSDDGKAPPLLLTEPRQLLNGPSLVLNQFTGLLLKRLHFARRYWPMVLFQIVVPNLIIVAAMIIQKAGKSLSDVKSAHVTYNTKDLYGAGTETFSYGSEHSLSSTYENLMTSKYSAHVSTATNASTDRVIEDWILAQANDNIDRYIQKYLFGFGFNLGQIAAWFSAEQYHSLPLAINALFETILRTLVPAFKNTASIDVENSPVLDVEQSQQFQLIAPVFSWALVCLIFLPIAFPFLAASYILYPVKENASKSKLIQLMTGLSPVTFWIANFLFDLLNHIIAITILYGIIYFLDSDKLFFGGHHGASSASILYLLLLSFGIATIPLVYFLSYFFSKPSSGFVFLIITFFLVGFISNIVFSILDFLLNYMKMTGLSAFWYNFSLYIFRFMPIFSMLFGYQKVQKLSLMTTLCSAGGNVTQMCERPESIGIALFRGCCPGTCEKNGGLCYFNENPFAFGAAGSGIEVIFMLVTGLLSFTMIVLYETFKQQFTTFFSIFSLSRLSKSTPPATVIIANGNGHVLDKAIPLTTTLDSDVEMERIRIEDEVRRKAGTLTDLLTVANLTKKFGNFTAVDGLSFGVHYNEVFGLLGVNGAGKTTTFSMLTGDLLPTSGNAYIQKGTFSLIDSMRSFQRQIGYCPQFDALLDKLTGEETLLLFARLRGVPASNLTRDVRHLIQMTGLEAHAQKRTENYSGGNKRKLSIAMSLIGNPPILFLDEPSAGVDPAARRKIWQTLGYLKRNFNSSIVLTSHSMEECEALCSRIGIMVNGRFRCLGSTQHLRSKYGQGYSVTISLRREHEADQAYVGAVQMAVGQLLPSSVLKDYHQSLMHYHITDPNEKWSNIFKQMAVLNDRYQFEDYFVSDTTLEQIFIMFARHQK